MSAGFSLFVFTERPPRWRGARGSGRLTIPATLVVLLASPAPARTEEGPTLVVTQTPIADVGALPSGSRLMLIDPARQARPLLEGFAAYGFADVSFDGKRLLFVGRRSSSDKTGVWELTLEGNELRYVVDMPGECLRAIYLPAIYTIDADKPVDQIAVVAIPSNETTPALYTCHRNGGRLRRITFAPEGAADPALLSDGRLVFSMAVNTGDGIGSSLFSINTDGTDLFPFAALHAPLDRRAMPCALPDDRVVFVESAASGDDAGGAIYAVERTRSLNRPVRLTAERAGRYAFPTSDSGGRLLASYRGGSGSSYGIVQLDSDNGTILRTVFDDPAWHDLAVRVVGPRSRPPGRSSVVNDQSDTGQLFCLDAYLTDLSRTESGTIRHVRVLQKTGNDSVEATLGEVPVEADGSFFLELPARMPFRLETLDADRKVLRSMRTWMWVMPNERRGCIGCHENRSLTPPNRHVLSLRRRPDKLQATSPAALNARPSEGAGP